MIDVKCAVVILNPYFLGIQLEGIAGKFQGLRGMFVSSGMINRYVLVLRYPFHNIHHPLRRHLLASRLLKMLSHTKV